MRGKKRVHVFFFFFLKILEQGDSPLCTYVLKKEERNARMDSINYREIVDIDMSSQILGTTYHHGEQILESEYF